MFQRGPAAANQGHFTPMPVARPLHDYANRVAKAGAALGSG